MEYLNIIYSSRRVRPGNDVEVRWDVHAPDLKEWMSFLDLDIYLDALNLVGVGPGMPSFPISVASAHINTHIGSLTFMLPKTVPPGTYELTFSLALHSKARGTHEIYVPHSPLPILVLDSGGGDTQKRARIDSVHPDRYSIAQLADGKAVRFELRGENLNLITTMNGVLSGRATSNYGIALFIIERGSEVMKLSASLSHQQLSWLKPGLADIVIRTAQGKAIAQVRLY